MRATSSSRSAVPDVTPTSRGAWLTDLGWGLFLLWTGTVWLVPHHFPAGSWMSGVGLLLLAIVVARFVMGARVGLGSLVLALLVLVGGLAELSDTRAPVIPLALLLGGAAIALRTLTPMWHRRSSRGADSSIGDDHARP
jgi:hypothetical protein